LLNLVDELSSAPAQSGCEGWRW